MKGIDAASVDQSGFCLTQDYDDFADLFFEFYLLLIKGDTYQERPLF